MQRPHVREQDAVSFAHAFHRILFLDVFGPFWGFSRRTSTVSNAGKQVDRKYNRYNRISEMLFGTLELILHSQENIEKNQRDRAQKDKQKADQD